MSKLYKLYLRAILNDLPASLDKASLSTLTAINIARRDQVNAQPFNLLTRAEFQAELKRLTVAAPAVPPIKLLPCNPQNKIGLIKVLREIAQTGGFDSGLKECKDIVDGLVGGVSFTFKVKTAEQRESCVRTLRAAGAVIA